MPLLRSSSRGALPVDLSVKVRLAEWYHEDVTLHEVKPSAKRKKAEPQQGAAATGPRPKVALKMAKELDAAVARKRGSVGAGSSAGGAAPRVSVVNRLNRQSSRSPYSRAPAAANTASQARAAPRAGPSPLQRPAATTAPVPLRTQPSIATAMGQLLVQDADAPVSARTRSRQQLQLLQAPWAAHQPQPPEGAPPPRPVLSGRKRTAAQAAVQQSLGGTGLIPQERIPRPGVATGLSTTLPLPKAPPRRLAPIGADPARSGAAVGGKLPSARNGAGKAALAVDPAAKVAQTARGRALLGIYGGGP